jgi:hypothetical protein
MRKSDIRRAFLSLLSVAALMTFSLHLSALASESFEPTFRPTLDVKRTSETVKIDGRLNEGTWITASRADNFVERHPGDNTRPEVETEAYITYDDANLYVAFVCHDNPSTIRATMCERDQFNGDDVVCLLVDPYGDANWAYEFLVNPYGIQKDYLWSRVHGEDRGFDLIWESASQITGRGYQVEIAIPFESLRFPNKKSQTWRVDFWRSRPRESDTQYSWAAYDRDEQCWPCQWGTVTGIKDVHPGKGFEIMPTMIANQSGSLSDPEDPTSPFDNSSINGEMSLGGKYSVSSNVTAEATYNPDFSQVEADAAQIDVNTTIALLYPERRPFFQEGSDIFRTIFNSFYTRTVNDPQFAGKLTARLDGTTIGFLTALDENTPYIIPLEEESILLNTGRSFVNVLRASRSLGENSQLGLIFTDRRFEHGGSGTIAAIDGDIRLTQNYSIVGQFIASHTREADDSSFNSDLEEIRFDNGEHTAALDGESYSGSAFITQLRRRARHWNFTVDYNQVGPSYQTQTGYDPWNDYRNFSIYSSYTIYPERGIFERITPEIYTDTRWNFDNERKWAHLNFGLGSQLSFAQTYVYAGYSQGSERWEGVDFDDLWETDMYLGSRISDQVGFEVGLDVGRGVALGDLVRGNETSLYASLELKPVDRLIVEPNVNFARSTDVDTGEELYEGYITRTRIRCQFNRELSLRLVVQYNDFSEKWEVDPLLTYRVSPFSLFYVGSTYDYNSFSFDPSSRPEWKLSSRQFFMKLQYLFRT